MNRKQPQLENSSKAALSFKCSQNNKRMRYPHNATFRNFIKMPSSQGLESLQKPFLLSKKAQ